MNSFHENGVSDTHPFANSDFSSSSSGAGFNSSFGDEHDLSFKPPPPKGPPPFLQSGNHGDASGSGISTSTGDITPTLLLADWASAAEPAVAGDGWGVAVAASSAVNADTDAAAAAASHSTAANLASAASTVSNDGPASSTEAVDNYMMNAGTRIIGMQPPDVDGVAFNAARPSSSGAAAALSTPPALPMWDSGFYEEGSGALLNASTMSSDGDVGRIISIHTEQEGEVRRFYSISAVNDHDCRTQCLLLPPPPSPPFTPLPFRSFQLSIEDSRSETPFESALPHAAACSSNGEFPAAFKARMEQVRIAMMLMMTTIMLMLVTITMMPARNVLLMLTTNTQLLEYKELEIKRLEDENAQLRRDLERLRGIAGEEMHNKSP